MEFNIKHIIQGWSNLAFPKEEAKKFLAELEEYRLGFCRVCPSGCPDITYTSTCADCGCFLKAKARCTDCGCPQGKWRAIASTEEDEEFSKLIKE